MTNTPTTALIYTRVSTDEQACQGYSLDAQLAEARRYAARQQWIIGSEFQDILSGRRDDRPQYQALLAEVRRLRTEGRPVTVVVAALDRFGRSILERIRSRDELKRLGVPTHSVREGGEVSDLVANILASVAQEESRRLGERVLASRDHLAAQGWKPSGRAPWGYLWRAATEDERRQGSPSHVLDLDPIAAPHVTEAFGRVAGGASVRAATAWVAGLPAAARGGRSLEYSCIRDALSAAVYAGRVDQRAEPDVLARPRGHWPALVDDATWLTVQTRIRGHAKTPRQASQRFLLTGLLRCPCGGRMVGSANTGRRPPRYTCSSRLGGPAAPDVDCRSGADVGQLDAGVLDAAAALIAPLASTEPQIRAELRRAWAALCRPAEVAGEAHRRHALERTAAQARTRLTTAATLLVDGEIDKAGYEALRDKSQADLLAAEAELSRLGAARPAVTLPPLAEVLTLAGGWTEIIASGSIAAQRELLGLLVAKITPERLARGKYRPLIEWTTLGAALAELERATQAAA
jgi:DNA invertase Pin-like site-specific DNA recombinase